MKNMKRKALIVAVMALLLIAILAMSVSTFAKYTTSATTDSKTATVAKWGFVVNAQAGGLFADQYGGTANGLADAYVSGDTVFVDANGDYNVVAPGTTGSLTFSITGTAEVRSQVTVTVSGTDVALTYDSDGAESLPAETYNPIKWTLTCAGNDVVNATLATSCTNVTLAEIVAFIDAMDATVEANAAYTYAGTYTLTWAWNFQNASGITGLTANQADTILGAAAANSVNNGAYTYTDPQGNAFACTAKTGVDFTMSIEVSQIQK